MSPQQILNKSKKIILSLRFALIVLFICTVFTLPTFAQKFQLTWKVTVSDTTSAYYPEGMVYEKYVTTNDYELYWEGYAEFEQEVEVSIKSFWTFGYENFTKNGAFTKICYYDPAGSRVASCSTVWTEKMVLAGEGIEYIKNHLILSASWAIVDIGDGRRYISMPFHFIENPIRNPRTVTDQRWGDVCMATIPVPGDYSQSYEDYGGFAWMQNPGDIYEQDETTNTFSKTIDTLYRVDEVGNLINPGTHIIWAHWEITVEVLDDECMVDVDPQYQDVGEWSDDCFDHRWDPDGDGKCAIGDDMASWGCGITCLSMALSYAGFETNPGDLNEFLKNIPDGFFWDPNELHHVPNAFVAVNEFTSHNLTWFGASIPLNYCSDPDIVEGLLEDIVCANATPVMVSVLNSGVGPGHHVLVIGKEDNRWKIIDPWNAVGNNYLDEYGCFSINGNIAPPSGLNLRGLNSTILVKGVTNFGISNDLSELIIAVTESAELMVVDQDGNHTGLDMESQEVLNQIPESTYAQYSIMNQYTQEIAPYMVKVVNVKKPRNGIYHIVLKGLMLDGYKLYIKPYFQDGTSIDPIYLSGITNEDSTATFDIQYNPAPGTDIIVFPPEETTDSSDSNDSIGKGLCFIATAAHGSPLHPYVETLRDFRDKYLISNKFGRALVNFYYNYSPFVAELIAKHKVLKVLTRINLLPLVVFSYSMVHFGPIITVFMLVFIFMVPVFIVLIFQRKLRQIKAKDPKALASL